MTAVVGLIMSGLKRSDRTPSSIGGNRKGTPSSRLSYPEDGINVRSVNEYWFGMPHLGRDLDEEKAVFEPLFDRLAVGELDPWQDHPLSWCAFLTLCMSKGEIDRFKEALAVGLKQHNLQELPQKMQYFVAVANGMRISTKGTDVSIRSILLAQEMHNV